MSHSKIDILSLQSGLNRPLLLDGAMGSLLTLDKNNYNKWFWASLVNLNDPKSVIEAHRKYIEAGAEIITTNTFRTNPAAIERSAQKIDFDAFIKKSVDLAISARSDKQIAIAGSNAPAEDCYQVDRVLSKSKLEYNHKKHIELLWECGSDFILNETQSHWDEIDIISKFCSDNKIPFVLSFFFTADLKLLSGEPLNEAVEFVKDYSPIAIGLNCIDYKPFVTAVETLNQVYKWGFYLNCGSGTYTDTVITCGIDEKEYLDHLKKWIPLKPLFVGACCGSKPSHIRIIKEYFDEIS